MCHQNHHQYHPSPPKTNGDPIDLHFCKTELLSIINDDDDDDDERDWKPICLRLLRETGTQCLTRCHKRATNRQKQHKQKIAKKKHKQKSNKQKKTTQTKESKKTAQAKEQQTQPTEV